MNVTQFIAPDAASALARIHEQLGPEAVVLSVRPLPVHGVARLLPHQRRIEVLAGLPDYNALAGSGLPTVFPEGGGAEQPVSNHWQSVAWLEAMGLLPAHAERLQLQLNTLHGGASLPSLEEEWTAVSAALDGFWRVPLPLADDFLSRPHVFIGPPGCGKTTALCKWLTLAMLTEERLARVWRLDGSSANTAEFLTIHCEILGAPVERFWSPPNNRAELLFIDLPGVEAHDRQALSALRDQLAALPKPHIHLVLNAAYETPTLFEQLRAFSILEPEDLIFTHLDEETRRVKLWNFIFGTNYTVRFMSAGQKIPGVFQHASPALLFPAGIPR